MSPAPPAGKQEHRPPSVVPASSPSSAGCHGDKGNACRCLIVTETRATQMMGRIQEDLQPALQLQQEGSESRGAPSSR